VCGRETMFFSWTSSRYFPRRELIEYFKYKAEKDGVKPEIYYTQYISMDWLTNYGYPVCSACRNMLENERYEDLYKGDFKWLKQKAIKE